MTDIDHSFDDPIADAILSNSTYDRLRLRRLSYFKQTIPQKLAWHGGLLFSLTFILPLTAGYPVETRALFGATTPITASPKVLFVGLFAATILLASAGTLVAVTLRRLQLEPDLSEAAARRLLTVEDVATLFGFLTGSFTVFLTIALFFLGYTPPQVVSALVDFGGTGLYASSGVGVSVFQFGLAVIAGSILVVAASAGLSRVLN